MTELYDCSKCNGTGDIKIDGKDWVCDKCDGWGEVDWIEQITGIEPGTSPRSIKMVTEFVIKE